MISRKRAALLVLAFLAIGSMLVIRTQLANAAFNPNNLIDDAVFDNTGTMSAAAIDNFINGFPNSCIGNAQGFTAPDPIGYSPSAGYTYGGAVSAGKVIYDAAQAYGINPQVLLTTLQKEQSLVAGGGGCSTLAYTAAVGYGCPDAGTTHSFPAEGALSAPLYYINGNPVTSVSGTCVNSASKAGFSQQVIRGAWLLKFGEQRSEGNTSWAVIKGNWDNSDDPATCYGGPMTQGTFKRCSSDSSAVFYDGYDTIDGSSIHIGNGATAALYWYTPHFSGNQHFDTIFAGWFGGIYAAPYSATYYGQSGYPSLNPGQSAASYFMYQNTGDLSWYDDNSIGSAPAGSYPVHLATSHTLNRSSSFGPTWPNPSRAADLFAAVYASDGVTLTNNQHVVLPGQIVKFGFTMTAPAGLAAANYPEYFQPIAEGTQTGAFNDPGTAMLVTVNPVPNITYVGQSSYPTVPPGTSSPAYLTLSNNGSAPLYDDSSISGAPAGSFPVHLATSNPTNRSSSFSSDWPSAARADVNFAAVYNSDGTTLASNQHVALPGQIIKFSFNFTAPTGFAANTYQEYVRPILEGTSDGYFADQGISWTVTVPQTTVFSVSPTPQNTSLVSNQPGSVSYLIKNVGNTASPSNTQLVTGSPSSLATPAWSSSSVVQTLPQSLTPGGSVTIIVPILAPKTSSDLTAPLGCGFVSGTTAIATAASCTVPVQVSGTSYQAQTVSSPSAITLGPNQVGALTFKYKNNGNQPWYDDSSVRASTWRSPLPTHLATAQSLNRSSGFASGWPNPSRPAVTFTAVYNSDGTTLASDQHVALPGQIVNFSFNVSPQSWVPRASYNEYFQPIIEGTSDGAINNQNSYVSLTAAPATYRATYYSQSAYPSLNPGQQVSSYFMYQNSGNQSWYDDSSIGRAPAGSFPIHLATTRSINRSSAFGAGWPNYSRPAVTFTAVYNSDGTTLASDQHVALPGQIVKFGFTLTAPASGLGASTYPEYFQPVAEGTQTGAFNDPGTDLLVTTK